MKSLKQFRYKNTLNFQKFLKAYNYILDDVKGFKAGYKEQYNGNVLKTYIVYFNNGDDAEFKVAVFKNFNEYRQSALGFNGDKLLTWYQDANIREYKLQRTY